MRWLPRMAERPASALTSRFPGLIALALGAIAALGFAPLHLWPLTLLALAGLIELTARAETWRRAARTGWLFGVGHFTVGNGWIATSFTYQAEMPAWLGWIAVVALALYLAVYPMLAVLGTWRLGRASRAAMVLAFAGCWIITEWLRSWVFTGFAWNPLAVIAVPPPSLPSMIGLGWLAPWMGTYGLSGLIVLLGGAIWLVYRTRGRAALAAALLPGIIYNLPLMGSNRAKGTLPFTLVQPDIRQEVLNDPAHYEDQFVKTAQLTLPSKRGARRLVLWPESGVPDYLREGYPAYFYRQATYAADPVQARQRIGTVIGPGAMLLTGAVDLEIDGDWPRAARNVVTAIDETGKIRGSYAKAHLVPYGEYLALRWLLEPLGATRLVPGALDFLPGPGPRTLDLGPWGRPGVQICYEIIFSGQVADRAHRPDFIFNPSNDGWFGAWGPPQHLAQARLRAIEEGLPVLRATTTGISAVIDAQGVVRQQIPRHKAARIDGLVPPAAAPTPFARWGNGLPLAWAAAFLSLSLVAMRRARS